MIVKAISRGFDIILYKLRWLFYTLTIFIWHRPAPFSTTIYGRIRRLYLPLRLNLGKHCRIGDGTYFSTTDRADITLGDRVNINLGCVLVAIEGISIGENTSIAEYVSIRDQAHKSDEEGGVRGGQYVSAPVSIGRNVWIGRGVYIGAGTTIGDNCVVGANSVVHGNFPPFSLIAGAPAKVKKRLPGAPAETEAQDA